VSAGSLAAALNGVAILGAMRAEPANRNNRRENSDIWTSLNCSSSRIGRPIAVRRYAETDEEPVRIR
jgi:hypothetical protein